MTAADWCTGVLGLRNLWGGGGIFFFLSSSPTSCIYSTPWSCKLLDLEGRCSPQFRQPREVCSTYAKHSTVQKGAGHCYTCFSFLFVFSCFFNSSFEQQSRCTLPLPPRRPHSPTSFCRFLRTGEKREQENKSEKEMQNNLRPCFPADPLRPSCDREASSAKTGCGSHH